MKKILHKILKPIGVKNPDLKQEITGLSLDSRKVKSGDLFLAYPGAKSDARNYIHDAIKAGAVAVVVEEHGFKVPVIPRDDINSVPVVTVPDLQKKLGLIAAEFYDHPSRKMNIIGITGTNGKTSCSHFIANALQLNQISCGIIGTLGVGFPGKLDYGVYTTPDAIVLQQMLFDLHNQGAAAVAMEVSSHGLEQERVAGIDFNIAVFTNLSRDHLDYHGDMGSYSAAKKRLFFMPKLKHAVINVDDEFGKLLLSEIPKQINTIGYSVADTSVSMPCVHASNIKTTENGFIAEVLTPWGDGTLAGRLLGRFNVSNLLAVLTVLGIMKIPLVNITQSLEQLDTLPGRMQTFGGGKKPLVVVDFAHTPDALEKALVALRAHCRGNLWCVFGCGGDRDRGKRPLMGQIAEQYSDHIVITNDNPRTEDSKDIIDDIVEGLLCPWAAEIERDRGSAIAHAIDCAKQNDIILIAGKGHEPHQIIGTKKIPYSDIEQVKSLLA